MKNARLKCPVKNSVCIIIMSLMLTTISCKQNTREHDRTIEQTQVESRDIEREIEPRAFTGEIRNVGNSGNNLSGEIAMRIEGDLMRFTVSAEGLAPDMMHMQYLLVSQTGDETQCPGSAEEAERIGENNATATSGTTIRRIPLHTAPSNLQMDADTYPRTNINGELQFSQVVSLDSLRNAVKNEYQMQDLDFSRFTFVIRGIPEQRSSQPQRRASGTQTPTVGCAKLRETAVSD